MNKEQDGISGISGIANAVWIVGPTNSEIVMSPLPVRFEIVDPEAQKREIEPPVLSEFEKHMMDEKDVQEILEAYAEMGPNSDKPQEERKEAPLELHVICQQNGTFKAVLADCGDDICINENDTLIICREGVDKESLAKDSSLELLCGGQLRPSALMLVRNGKGSGTFRMVVPTGSKNYNHTATVPQMLTVDRDQAKLCCHGYCSKEI
jgi:hypothetical protein